MTLLHAYIVGAQKAGTTSLYNWLGQHPDVTAPVAAKDFPLFSGDYGGFEQRLSRMRSMYAQKVLDGGCVALGAEANLVFSERGIELLAAEAPECRIIFVIRRPDTRCFSAWRYARERGLEDRSFAEAINDEILGKVYSAESYEGRQKNYLEHSRYVDQLAELQAHFSEERILLLPFERMRETPEGIMALVCEFLDLTPGFVWDFRALNKTAGRGRSSILNKILYRDRESAIFTMLRCVTPATLRTRVREWAVRWNRVDVDAERIDPDPETMHRLSIALADEVRLHELTIDRVDAWLRARGVAPKQ